MGACLTNSTQHYLEVLEHERRLKGDIGPTNRHIFRSGHKEGLVLNSSEKMLT